MAIAMRADERTVKTKGDLRQLRADGMVPGTVYGKLLDASSSVSVREKDLRSLLRSQPNAVLELEVPGQGKHSVMVADVQRDSLSGGILHVDFHQINMNEAVRANVRIEYAGESVGVREGGILSVVLHELEVQCLPAEIPESVSADISSLNIGESLQVKDIKLSQGVEAISDPELVVLTVLAPQKELDEEEAEAQDVEAKEAESRSDHAQHEEISTST